MIETFLNKLTWITNIICICSLHRFHIFLIDTPMTVQRMIPDNALRRTLLSITQPIIMIMIILVILVILVILITMLLLLLYLLLYVYIIKEWEHINAGHENTQWNTCRLFVRVKVLGKPVLPVWINRDRGTNSGSFGLSGNPQPNGIWRWGTRAR